MKPQVKDKFITVKCRACDGSGSIHWEECSNSYSSGYDKCKACKGSGQVEISCPEEFYRLPWGSMTTMVEVESFIEAKHKTICDSILKLKEQVKLIKKWRK